MTIQSGSLEKERPFSDWLYSDIDENEYLNKLYSKLVLNYSKMLIGYNYSLSDYEINSLLRFADILSKSIGNSKSDFHKNLAQNIVTMLDKMSINNEKSKYILGSVLTNVNNYVGLNSQTPDYSNSDIFEFMAEEISKLQHKIPNLHNENGYFKSSQKIAYDKLNASKLYSFSAPTSMGKTFFMKTYIKSKIINNEKIHDHLAIILNDFKCLESIFKNMKRIWLQINVWL